MMGLYLKKNSKMLINSRLDVPQGTSGAFCLKIQIWIGKRLPFYLETRSNFHTLKTFYEWMKSLISTFAASSAAMSSGSVLN